MNVRKSRFYLIQTACRYNDGSHFCSDMREKEEEEEEKDSRSTKCNRKKKYIVGRKHVAKWFLLLVNRQTMHSSVLFV